MVFLLSIQFIRGDTNLKEFKNLNIDNLTTMQELMRDPKEMALNLATSEFEEHYGLLTITGRIRKVRVSNQDDGSTWYYIKIADSNKKVIENYIYVDYEGELYSYWNAPEHLRENKYDNKN